MEARLLDFDLLGVSLILGVFAEKHTVRGLEITENVTSEVVGVTEKVTVGELGLMSWIFRLETWKKFHSEFIKTQKNRR